MLLLDWKVSSLGGEYSFLNVPLAGSEVFQEEAAGCGEEYVISYRIPLITLNNSPRTNSVYLG